MFILGRAPRGAEGLAPPHSGEHLSQRHHLVARRHAPARIAEDVVHPSQRGFFRGRDLLTVVAELEVAVTRFPHDAESEPAAVLLDVAAAFPSAECEYIRRALDAQRVPPFLVDALFAMYWPAHIEVNLNGRTTSIRVAVTRGIRQGCPASGTVWAFYDPVVRCLWGAVPHDELWLTAFAADVAVALRNVFRDHHVARRTLDDVSAATGLRFNPCKSIILSTTRTSHVVARDLASEGSGFFRRAGWDGALDVSSGRTPLRSDGRPFGRSSWRVLLTHVKAVVLHSCDIPYTAVSVVGYTAQLFPLDVSMRSAEHAAIANVFLRRRFTP